MSRRFLVHIFCALVLLVSFIASATSQEAQTHPSRKLTIEELSQTTVVGRLGEPLGTFVTIEGEYRVPKGTAKVFEYELTVRKVNGKASSVKIHHDQVEWELYLDDEKIVRDRQTFRLIGFERAEYRGYIQGEGKFDQRFATIQRTPEKWGLHSRFHVLAQGSSNKQMQRAGPQGK
jgi:hypothetical protein